jgi:diacylglycerol kinase (ATP)
LFASQGDLARTAHHVRPATARGAVRAGVIRNPRSHQHSAGRSLAAEASGEVMIAIPDTTDAIDHALTAFAAARIDLLVVDGGDGTVREVISRAPEIFGTRMPRLTILPNGKTNALSLDLSEGQPWSLGAALSPGAGRIKTRRPLEIWRPGAATPELRGFILGTGAYVRAIRLGQHAHRLGAFNDLAVALTVVGAVGRSLLAGDRNPWRAGEALELSANLPAAPATLLLMASTLKRMPLGLMPFGPLRDGLKVLTIDAPGRRLAKALRLLVSGEIIPWLEEIGYHRRDPEEFCLSLAGEVVLDGEIYPGGDLIVRTGEPLEFLVP